MNLLSVYKNICEHKESENICFEGKRDGLKTNVWYHKMTANNTICSTGGLPKYLDTINHSPDGFQWGYEGSGPAQLALAILMFITNDSTLAIHRYQEFKRDIISKIQEDRWILKGSDILEWLHNQENKYAKERNIQEISC